MVVQIEARFCLPGSLIDRATTWGLNELSRRSLPSARRSGPQRGNRNGREPIVAHADRGRARVQHEPVDEVIAKCLGEESQTLRVGRLRQRGWTSRDAFAVRSRRTSRRVGPLSDCFGKPPRATRCAYPARASTVRFTTATNSGRHGAIRYLGMPHYESYIPSIHSAGDG